MGTLAYMAPEQADPSLGRIDARTDVHALGVLLYELSTGRHPFCLPDEPLTPMETQLRILVAEPAPICTLRPDFPAELGRIAERCLKKRPAERFATMREVSDALGEVLARLRSERYGETFAALGLDPAAAHEALRRSRGENTDAAGAPGAAGARMERGPAATTRGAGGFHRGQVRTVELAAEQVAAFGARAVRRVAAGGPGEPRHEPVVERTLEQGKPPPETALAALEETKLPDTEPLPPERARSGAGFSAGFSGGPNGLGPELARAPAEGAGAPPWLRNRRLLLLVLAAAAAASAGGLTVFALRDRGEPPRHDDDDPVSVHAPEDSASRDAATTDPTEAGSADAGARTIAEPTPSASAAPGPPSGTAATSGAATATPALPPSPPPPGPTATGSPQPAPPKPPTRPPVELL